MRRGLPWSDLGSAIRSPLVSPLAMPSQAPRRSLHRGAPAARPSWTRQVGPTAGTQLNRRPAGCAELEKPAVAAGHVWHGGLDPGEQSEQSCGSRPSTEPSFVEGGLVRSEPAPMAPVVVPASNATVN